MPSASHDQSRIARRAATSGATLLLVLLVLTALPNGVTNAAAPLAEPHRSSTDARDVSREFRTLATRLVAAERLRNGLARAAATPERRALVGASLRPTVAALGRETPEPAGWGVRTSLLNLPPPRA